MQNATNAALDRVASTLGIQSDYAIAKALHISRSNLTTYRDGGGQLGDETAIRAAQIAHLNPACLLAKIQAERAKSPEVRKVWESLALLAEQSGLSNAKSPA